MSYQVKIEIFEGPLDLLLHLIQKDDLDIYDIPISQITTEYLQYLELLKELNLNVAGDFLVMAATLMQIKAKTLLPQEKGEDGEILEDPRDELVQRLLEYQKFKEASQFLEAKFETHRNVMYRGAPIFSKGEQSLDVNITQLLDAFSSVLETAKSDIREIVVEEIPVEVRIRELLTMLENNEYLSFGEIFPKGSTRNYLVVTFLALLELIRLHQVRTTQSENFGEIHIQRVLEAAVEV